MKGSHMLRIAALLALLGTAAAPLEAQRTPEQQARREVAQRGWLGISYRITADGAAGAPGRVIVDEVLPGSPADRAGVQRGDTLVRWNGRGDVAGALREMRLAPGDTVRLRVRRAGERDRDLTLVAGDLPARAAFVPRVRGIGGDRGLIVINGADTVFRLDMDSLRVHADSMHQRLRMLLRDSLGPQLRVLEGEMMRAFPEFHVRVERPGEPPQPPFAMDLAMGMRGVAGAEFTELNRGLAEYFDTRQGVLVLRVAPETPAARAGLEAGDVVVRVNEQPVASVSDLRRAVTAARDRAAKLEVVRKGKRRELQLRWER